MEVMELKTVGRSGQISLGKASAGKHYFVKNLPSGDVMLQHAMLVPANEQWLHTAAMKDRLAASDAWMAVNSAQETGLADLAQRAGVSV